MLIYRQLRVWVINITHRNSFKKKHCPRAVFHQKLTNLTLNKIFKSTNQQELDKIQNLIQAINEKESETKSLSEGDFKEKTFNFKKNAQSGLFKINEIIPESFALVREASNGLLENVILMCSCWEDLHCIMVISLKWQQVKEKLYPQLVLFFSTLYQEMACI